jgi:uncharacterized protein (TIGR00299 family) protein
MHVHLDLVGGIAGDMFLAAALDAGLVAGEEIEATLGTLGVGDVRLEVARERRGGLAGTHLRFRGWKPEEEHHHRHLRDILALLDRSALPEGIASRAASLFRLLGEAEAEVHGVRLEEVHFHEVGALDSIFDLVAAAYLLETIPAGWSVGPVPVGRGSVSTAHGLLPLPAPATARLLRGFELVPREVSQERVTPTGAAILRALGQDRDDGLPSRRCKAGILRATGHGLGSREIPGLPNLLRLLVLEGPETSETEERDQVVRLECEIDDMSPEVFPHVEGRLFEAGALDVTRQATAMKKGRVGTQLAALCRHGDEEGLIEVLFLETTTLGVRLAPVERRKMPRRRVEVETPFGPVEVKVAYWRGRVVKVAPEHESCARVARAVGAPLREVMQAAQQAAGDLLRRLPDDSQ